MREKILFFDEVILYEDELDDNGCAVLSAKIVSVRKILEYLDASERTGHKVDEIISVGADVL